MLFLVCVCLFFFFFLFFPLGNVLFFGCPKNCQSVCLPCLFSLKSLKLALEAFTKSYGHDLNRSWDWCERSFVTVVFFCFVLFCFLFILKGEGRGEGIIQTSCRLQTACKTPASLAQTPSFWHPFTVLHPDESRTEISLLPSVPCAAVLPGQPLQIAGWAPTSFLHPSPAVAMTTPSCRCSMVSTLPGVPQPHTAEVPPCITLPCLHQPCLQTAAQDLSLHRSPYRTCLQTSTQDLSVSRPPHKTCP